MTEPYPELAAAWRAVDAANEGESMTNDAAERLEAIPGWMAEEEGGVYYRVEEADAALAHERQQGREEAVREVRERLNMREVSVGPIEAFSKRSVHDVLVADASEEPKEPHTPLPPSRSAKTIDPKRPPQSDPVPRQSTLRSIVLDVTGFGFNDTTWQQITARLSAVPAALDVERLCQAWSRHLENDHADDDYDAPTNACAEQVATEYARLQSPDPTGEEQER